WKGEGDEKGIAFSEFGFGPRRPWGAIYASESKPHHVSMRDDGQWYRSFLETWLGTFAPVDLPIWRVVRRRKGMVEYLSPPGLWRERLGQAAFLDEHDHSVFHYTIDSDIFPRKRRSDRNW